MLDIVILLVSVVLLAKSSDVFVDSAVRLARILRVKEYLVGLTIIAFGTSLPELITTLVSVINGVPAVGVGTVLGSNITNICLIIGLVVFLGELAISTGFKGRSIELLAGSSILLLFFSMDSVLSTAEGVVMLAVFGVYLWMLLKPALKKQEPSISEYVSEDWGIQSFFPVFPIRKHDLELLKQVGLLLVSLAGILLFASLAVDNASLISKRFEIDSGIIGLTLLAVGTSLPELSVAFTSFKKGHTEIFFGNIVGANISNILMVFGLSSLLKPLVFSPLMVSQAIPLVLIVSMLLYVLVVGQKKIPRWQGAALLAIFVAFLAWSALNASG